MSKQQIIDAGERAPAALEAALAILDEHEGDAKELPAEAIKLLREAIELLGEVEAGAKRLSEARDKHASGLDHWQALDDAAMRLGTTVKDTLDNKYGGVPRNRLTADIDAFREAVEVADRAPE